MNTPYLLAMVAVYAGGLFFFMYYCGRYSRVGIDRLPRVVASSFFSPVFGDCSHCQPGGKFHCHVYRLHCAQQNLVCFGERLWKARHVGRELDYRSSPHFALHCGCARKLVRYFRLRLPLDCPANFCVANTSLDWMLGIRSVRRDLAFCFNVQPGCHYQGYVASVQSLSLRQLHVCAQHLSDA